MSDDLRARIDAMYVGGHPVGGYSSERRLGWDEAIATVRSMLASPPHSDDLRAALLDMLRAERDSGGNAPREYWSGYRDGLETAMRRVETFPLASPPHSEGPLDVKVLAEALSKVVPAVTFQAPAIAAEYARRSKGAAEQEEGNG